MRRYFLYFAVTLVAFSIGVLVVTSFRWFTKEATVVVLENKILEESPIVGFGTGRGDGRLNEPVYEPKLHKPACTDKKLLRVWNELKKDKEFKIRAAEEFYREADCSSMLDVREIDLNDDGQKEILLQGNNTNLCQRDDCLLWIFKKKGNKYQQILQSWATSGTEITSYSDGRGYKIGKRKSFGYKTITTKGGRNALAVQHSYQYDGNRYRETECLTFEYFVSNEKPSVQTCEEYGL